jgi:2-oxoglutarate ferredoxin oxidoreductase subunit alpha
LVAELNGGQLRTMLRATYLVDAIGLNKVQGLPFKVVEVTTAVENVLGGNVPRTDGPTAARTINA